MMVFKKDTYDRLTKLINIFAAAEYTSSNLTIHLYHRLILTDPKASRGFELSVGRNGLLNILYGLKIVENILGDIILPSIT